MGFQPTRDELYAAMVLRITYSDGSMAVIPFWGGSCDVGKRLADMRSSGQTVTAYSATELINDVANTSNGTVHCSAPRATASPAP